MCDYQESVTTGQTDALTDGQTDAGQSDSYMPLCFAGDTKSKSNATKVELDTILIPQIHTLNFKLIFPKMIKKSHESEKRQ